MVDVIISPCQTDTRFSVQTRSGGKFFSVRIGMNANGRLWHHFRHCLLAKLIISPAVQLDSRTHWSMTKIC